MTDNLVQFLRARLDEDGHVARLIQSGPGESPLRGLNPLRVEVDGEMRFAYVAADPARVLAEVEAKRRILDDVLPTMQADELRIAGEWGVGSDPVREASDDLLSLLALPYANHPDYRSEWAPDQA